MAVGLVELIEERLRRGGRERRYRTVRGTPLSDQRQAAPLLAETLGQTLRERASRRLPDTPGVTVDAELWVHPDTWDDTRRRLAVIAADLHDEAQPPRTPGTVPISLSMMAFAVHPSAAPESPTANRDPTA